MSSKYERRRLGWVADADDRRDAARAEREANGPKQKLEPHRLGDRVLILADSDPEATERGDSWGVNYGDIVAIDLDQTITVRLDSGTEIRMASELAVGGRGVAKR